VGSECPKEIGAKKMKIIMMKIRLTLIPLMGLLMTACATTYPPYGVTPGNGTIMAVVENEAIFEAEVNNLIPMGIFRNKGALANHQRMELSQLIIKKLLRTKAEKTSQTVSDLLSTEVFQGIQPITHEEVVKYFESHPEDFKKVDVSTAENIIRDVLYRERKRDALTTYYDTLIRSGQVKILTPLS